MNNDQIWEELSRVYNMPDVSEEAKETIGNVMLALDDDSLIVSPLLKKTNHRTKVLSPLNDVSNVD